MEIKKEGGKIMKTGWIVVILVVAVGLLAYILSYNNSYGTNTQSNINSPPSSQNGKVAFGLADAAANMGSVNSVKVKISDMQIHEKSSGWTTVSSQEREYDLLKLKSEGSTALMSDNEVKEGNYDQIRFKVTQVTVTDEKGDHDAKIPSNEMTFDSAIIVSSQSNNTATFDFKTDESVYKTDDNTTYVFAPVVEVETKENCQTYDDGTDSDYGYTKIHFYGGTTRTKEREAMDFNGNFGVNVQVDANAKIAINGGVITVVNGALSTNTNGKVILGLKDAAANLSDVSSIAVTINNAQIRNSEDQWITVSTTPKTFDLLKLNATSTESLIAEGNLSPGEYDQIRLNISQVIVTDVNGSHEAKLPSGMLKIKADITITANSTSIASFDVLASESLHITKKGVYILTPVINVETRDEAEVDEKDRENIRIFNGRVHDRFREGMDLQGNFGEGIEVKHDTDLDIDVHGRIIVIIVNSSVNVTGRTVITVKDPAVNMGSVSSVNVTVDSIQVHSQEQGWITASSTSKTFDLMKLNAKGSQSLLADLNLSAGNYDQTRLMISEVVVTDSSGSHQAKLPSGDLKIPGRFTVDANSTSTETLDFFANESLHVTGNGMYVMTPVLNVETRENAQVNDMDSENVMISSGNITIVKVGTDVNGNIGEGLEIAGNSQVDIDGYGNLIIIGSMNNGYN